MVPGARLVAIAIASAVAVLATPLPVEPGEIGEARSILREASALLPKIDELERASAAANIAGQQARAGDLGGALAALRSVRENDRGLVAHSIAFALVPRGQWRAAVQTIKDLPPSAPSSFPYEAVAQQLAAIGDFEDAIYVARIIRAQPNWVVPYFDSLRAICAEQWKSGNVAAALQTLEQAIDLAEHEKEAHDLYGFSAADWCTGLVRDLALTGYPQAASVVVERLETLAAQEQDRDRKRQILGMLAQSQATVGDFAAALELLDGLPPGEGRNAMLLSIALECARQGDPARTRELAAQASPKALDNTALKVLAYALGAAGDQAGALETLERIQSVNERAWGLAQLALQQAEKSDLSAAMTLMLAQEAQQEAGSGGMPFVLELMAVTRGYLGDFSGSVEILKRLNNNERTWPLWNLTAQLVAAGKKSEALALAHAQEGPHPRAYALLGTASEMIGEIEAAKKKASATK